ncbi:hypothetical protein [Nostoc sp. FACHB-888]|uniref:hypothetical protein n=1 Tax=Nostoc sp. FACHB-888 TaxID=2692842 RepID=UPI001684E95C|nr:hypothetical protein [Nostoc sp. FACHB-888]MBD2242222.1 hypothetical protein [Nostoc sp. FACHB-888]
MGSIQEVGDRVQIMVIVDLQSHLDMTQIFCDLDDLCKQFPDMTQDILNKLFSDKGYISHKLFSVPHHVFPPIRV